MDRYNVHFEVFVRKIPGAPWSLLLATEDRGGAVKVANEAMAERRVAAAKVTKETLDEETNEYRAVEILKLGAAGVAAKSRPTVEAQPLCVTPQDLYTLHARERISRLLEIWLERNNATPFELLHRPDLVDRLESSGLDLQHAIQKVSIPEAQARNRSVHEMMRTFQALIDRTVVRLMHDAQKGVLPNLAKEGFAAVAERVVSDPERAYLLGAGVAAEIAPAKTWSEKVERLMDLADAAPKQGPARGLAFMVLQQPLAEILETKPGMIDIMGGGRHLGGALAAMTRLAAYESVDRLMKVEASVAKVMPQLSPLALRLAMLLGSEAFQDTRAAIGRRILRELTGGRRLCPGDAAGEIDLLRALGMSLTAASGKLLPLEEVQSAFTTRSKTLVTGDFVEAYLVHKTTAGGEFEALVWLTENVIGAANKRQAGGWLKSTANSLRFNKEMEAPEESPTKRLARLAAMQRSAARCGLSPEDSLPIQEKLGEIGGEIEARAKLTQTLARAEAPILQRLTWLLKMAGGDTAPSGPAAKRARVEAMTLVKQGDIHTALTAEPEQVETFRDLIQRSGLAA
ncbi:hypothetical protein [Phenylobacterium sp.]|uniref:hypothetical protein n=1 Tax=Phenylobacterium sp. TaxID=1871053 RepID=UPI0037C7FFC7